MNYKFLKIIVLAIFLGLATSCNSKKYSVTTITAKNIAVDSTLNSIAQYRDTIAPYKAKMITKINEKLSYTPKDLVRTDGNLQSSLGNLMADLAYEEANPIFKEKTGKNIDFAMFNYGGIRSGIFKGPVLQKNAFELMPFENTLVVVELSGEKVAELFTYFIEQQRAHPLSKHLQLNISNNAYTAIIQGKPFNTTQSYFILTSNYLQSGGDNMNFFKDPIQLINTEYKVRDAIISYFRNVDTLKTSLDTRIILQ